MTSEARPPEAGDRRWRDGSEDVVVEILQKSASW